MSENPILEKNYEPRQVEPEMFRLWEQANAFASKPADTPHERTFTVVIPPPNVTGALHLGHALNNTLQDILVRYHRMRGFNTLWQPGTDHAGIATQAVVERRIRESEGKTRHEIGREELVRRIWEWKVQYEERILSQLKLMGCSCDWDRVRFTLDKDMARAVRQMFFKLFKDGLINRGKRLVNWDTQLQTAVSDDEVYYENVKGHFWHFKYPVIDPKLGEPDHVIIATTRPETMLGDTAVAVHPDPERYLSKQEATFKEQLTKASSKEKAEIQAKLETIAARRETHLAGLIKLRDMAKDGRMLLLPLVERKIPLICDDWAKPDLGSGCVKITPAHDPNDYEVGLRHNLPMISVMSADGKIARIVEPEGDVNSKSGDYEGLTFAIEGRAKVVADIEARELLHEIEDHDVELGHSDRSKMPIEPFLSDQWFVRTGDEEGTKGEPEPQASACAISESSATAHRAVPNQRETPDLSTGATLLTWTTYGTWLPGEDRGSVSRAPRDGGEQLLRNLPGEPYDNDDPQRYAASLERMEGKPVQLTPQHAAMLLASVATTCEQHGMELLAVAIMSSHVHVLCQSEQHGQELLQFLKGGASRRLNLAFELSGSPRWWTKSGSRRRIKPKSDLTAAIEYVKSQADPLVLWSFDVQSGEAAGVVEAARLEVHAGLERAEKSNGARFGSGEINESGAFARAEARGSGGVVLGDGTKSSGLAQAAMDSVEDGRIQIFPPRYAKSYLDWLGEKRDWCISRQLWWGHRIPVWTIRANDKLFKDLYEGSVGGLQHQTTAGVERQIKDRVNKFSVVIASFLDSAGEAGNYSMDLSGWNNWSVRIVARTSKANEALSAFRDYHLSIGPHESKQGMGRSVWEPFPAGFEETEESALEMSRVILDTDGAILRDEDVLDTWFSSALWPMSTLGWPEETEHFKQYYPGSVLVTARDIITNWVARMVMFGLYATGKVPFDRVYITPKILDGRGETMSKSKGNGVDPVDVIHTHGADALRYTMADMTTETQDIRMPVEYICPHCGKLTDQAAAIKLETQARKSRGQKLERKLQPADCHRVKCGDKECGKEFATQWASQELKDELELARDTSDKFDVGRNFCNKLWNAARFAFMNIENAPCESLNVTDLPPEDRWILAKLSQTVRRYHECIAKYQFAASVKELRDFFWDSLCDWYIELTKPRLTEPQASACATATDAQSVVPDPAKQVLAFCMDQVLRLWHPTMPFITERLWQQLNTIAPQRGLPDFAKLKTDQPLILSEFPPVEGYPLLDDDDILATFAELQDTTRGVRELRSACDISPKQRVKVTVAVPAAHDQAFKANAHIIRHMAGISELVVDASATRPKNAGSISVHNLRIFVHDISDDEADRKRTAKSLEQLQKQIAGKESKLSNEKFVKNAKPEVVQAERDRLEDMLVLRNGLQEHLAELGG